LAASQACLAMLELAAATAAQLRRPLTPGLTKTGAGRITPAGRCLAQPAAPRPLQLSGQSWRCELQMAASASSVGPQSLGETALPAVPLGAGRGRPHLSIKAVMSCSFSTARLRRADALRSGVSNLGWC
jgi:hypothetical protein